MVPSVFLVLVNKRPTVVPSVFLVLVVSRLQPALVSMVTRRRFLLILIVEE